MKWKDRLLSASVPLEYEVAKILKEQNYFTDFDFAYQRLDEKEEKEFSIDIKATNYFGFNNKSKVDIMVNLLIECKYRNPNIKWAFLFDLDKNEDNENLSPSKLPLTFIDEFSEVKLNNTWDALKTMDQSKKGVEINLENGEVHDRGIHHGINQLIYSLPIALARAMTFNLMAHSDDIYPYAYCPILVTNAELRILKEDFSIDSVKNADTFESISSNVPYLSFRTGLYPSFEKHCKNIFNDIPSKNDLDSYKYFNDLHAIKLKSHDGSKLKKSEEMFYKTQHMISELKKGDGRRYFSEVVICNLDHFPELINLVKDAAFKVIKDKKNL